MFSSSNSSPHFSKGRSPRFCDYICLWRSPAYAEVRVIWQKDIAQVDENICEKNWQKIITRSWKLKNRVFMISYILRVHGWFNKKWRIFINKIIKFLVAIFLNFFPANVSIHIGLTRRNLSPKKFWKFQRYCPWKM